MKPLVKTVWSLAKVGVAGFTVFAIAFAMGVLDSDLEVGESEADILSFGRWEVTPTEKFVSSMEDLGHSKPQVFNLNGNVVYFSTRIHDEDPLDVLPEYMNKFEEKGLLDRMPEKLGDADEAWTQSVLTGFNGGIVPMHVSENHVFMGGLVPKQEIKDGDELEALADRDGQPWEIFKGFHNLDITKMGDITVATSTWSDDNFDYAKTIPGNRSLDQNIDPEIPACPGCTRVSSMEDLDKNRTYRSNSYQGTSDSQHLMRFYDQALTSRGWRVTETTQYMEKAREYAIFEGSDAHQREYEKDGKLVTVLTHPDESGGSVAHTVLSD